MTINRDFAFGHFIRWEGVPAIPGCATQAGTFEELLGNIYEAVDARLSVDMKEIMLTDKDRVLEVVV